MAVNGTRILVTGSRHYRRPSVVRRALEPYRGHSLVLVHGEASGLDHMAAGIWRGWGEAGARLSRVTPRSGTCMVCPPVASATRKW